MNAFSNALRGRVVFCKARTLALLVATAAVPCGTYAQHPPKPPPPVARDAHASPALAARVPHANVVAHDAPETAGSASSSCNSLSALTGGGAVFPATAGPGFASFIDPSVHVERPDRVMIGCRSFVAPFASLDGSLGPIAIGDESNIQDNVLLSGNLLVIGDRVSIAHGATLRGRTSVGVRGGKPAFVGFNAFVDGVIIEQDAMVLHLARIDSGIVIRSGNKILPGKWVRTQHEADDRALGKVALVTDADRAFMAGVLHVNTALAAGYTDLFHSAPGQVKGAGRDPGHSDFNREANLPRFAGAAASRPELSMRVIGDVEMADAVSALRSKTGRNVAIRADEGEHFRFGIVAGIQDRVTFHALEHSNIEIGNNNAFGYHVVVHGGPDDASAPGGLTRLDDDVTVKDWAVVFRSKIGKGSVIGVRAYVDGSHLAPGTIVPDRAIMIKDKIVGYVEW